jgi:hypothetical protein
VFFLTFNILSILILHINFLIRFSYFLFFII